ncbi:unnamed protein product [Parnassius mnemosyne]|uniref:Cytochrome b-c1 complex subunit Rieske, mitochondrial n=1 Tax=Parnassius mnemosyne TaxID=213953 RepID=A0AAV1L2H1_9NEOP
MNFMTGKCLARYGYLNFWTTCCRSILKTSDLSKMSVNDDKNCKKTSYKSNSKFCERNTLSTPGPVFWTQVRFCKIISHYHRDVEFPNFDAERKNQFKDVEKTKWLSGDKKVGITYVVGFFGLVCGAYGVKGHMLHYIYSMSAAADVIALASIELDISKVEPGQCLSIKWRGKPLFVKHRTPADIELEAKTPLSSLRDPETPEQRTIKPEWLIVIGICTHLGCVPIANSGDWPGGFYCPCHGSHFDNVGRARKGPAPTNLVVPPYKFLTDNLLLVG